MLYSRITLLACCWLVLCLAGSMLPLWADDAPLPAAVARLADDNPLVRMKAAEELTNCGDKRAVPPLIATLKDEFSIVRSAVVTALGTLHDTRAVDALLPMVHDEDAGIVVHAVEALGNLGDTRAVNVLLDALKTADAPELHVAAIIALSKIPAPQSCSALLGALTDPAPPVRMAVITALGRLRNPIAGKPLAALLRDPEPDVRMAVISALSNIHAPEVSDLLSPALTDTTVAVRLAAVTALGNLRDPAAFPALARRLKDDDAGVQIAAITALSKIPEPKAIPLLLPLLQTGDNMTLRLAAAEALGRLRAAEAIPALLDLYDALGKATTTASPGVAARNIFPDYHRVTSALQRIGEPTLRALLATAHACRDTSASDLQQQQSRKAMQAWAYFLNDGWCQSRELKQALVELATIPQCAGCCGPLLNARRQWRLIEPLPGVLDNLYPELTAVRIPTAQREFWLNAQFGHARWQPEVSIESMIAGIKGDDQGSRRQYTMAMADLGDGRAVPALLDLLQHDTDASVREYVAFALGEIGDERAVTPLCERIKVDQTEMSRSAAAWALGQLGDPHVADTLATVLPGQSSRLQARAALALLQLGDTRGSETLATLLTNQDWMVSEMVCYDLANVHRPLPAIVPVLLEQIAKTRDVGKHYQLLRALASVADPTAAAPTWTYLQTHDEPTKNLLAARALANAANPELADALYQLAQDALEDDLRTAAALGLLKVHDARATNLLLDLAKAPFGGGRNSAVYALALVNDPRVADTCAALLEDDDPLTRALAARVLVLRKDARGVPVLLALLQDGTEEISRIAAARYLGEAKIRAAATPLCNVLKTGMPAECAACADALGAIGDPAAIPALTACRQDPISRVSQAAAKALKKLGVG